jgi:hypothetical protein
VTPAAWFDLLEARAAALRAVGVLEITLEGVAIKLAPLVPEPLPAAAQPASGPEHDDPDPLNNPALYPDGVVPGYTLQPDGGDA